MVMCESIFPMKQKRHCVPKMRTSRIRRYCFANRSGA